MGFEQWPMPPSTPESFEQIPDDMNNHLAAFLTKQLKQLEDRIDAAETRLASRLVDIQSLLSKKQ